MKLFVTEDHRKLMLATKLNWKLTKLSYICFSLYFSWSFTNLYINLLKMIYQHVSKLFQITIWMVQWFYNKFNIIFNIKVVVLVWKSQTFERISKNQIIWNKRDIYIYNETKYINLLYVILRLGRLCFLVFLSNSILESMYL